MTFCPNCKMLIAATYKKDGVRRYWEVSFETPMPKKESAGGGVGCGTALVILLVLAILIEMTQCDWKVPYKAPNDTPAEQFQN